ncbi:uncharacterized protein RCC_04259 [Ramularia collo-cygni]|uniref:Uncharacterized protein n=1 Tax=Ramularia collo-cygni TaxID=112498 RepID=A0A2D3V790_9PEZI|nr:uncharacterized protein RCC_04259 [Ramularia collo-cygni]CZT18414.1 uncharacterized protein RCC_04259 [Ramularia collo-cygni]
MSSSTSSFANTAREHNSSMSRYEKAHSVGASDLGRLALRRDSDAEMVETRTQAKKRESSRSKDKGKARAKAGSSSRSPDDKRKSRRTTSKGGQKRPSDDDDDDEGDDSSSDDEDEAPEPTVKEHFRMLVSVLNADHLSPVEFVDYPSSSMPLQSRTLRAYADNMAEHLNQTGRQAVWNQNPPSGAAWGEMAHQILNRRKISAEHRFISGDIDSIEALKQFDRIYSSIREMLVKPLYRNTHANAKKDLVYLLVDILNFIIREWRPRGGEDTLVYAGSAQGQERNIYMRFITKPDVQAQYMRTLMGLCLRADLRDLFKVTRVRESLVDSCARIHRYIAVTPPAMPVFGPLGNFSQNLERLLQQLSIPLPR